jgi:hypothetical protein
MSAPHERRQRHAAAEGLAEARQVRNHARGLLDAASRVTEAGHVRGAAHALGRTRRFEHHCRQLVPVSFVESGEIGQVVETEPMDERPWPVGNPSRAEARLLHPPVSPAVVPAEQDDVTAGEGARDARGHGAHVGAVLAEGDHLGARNVLDEHPGDLDLERVGERHDRGAAHRGDDRLLHPRLVVAEQRGAPAHHVVDVLAPFRVPHLASVRSLDEQGIGAAVGAPLDPAGRLVVPGRDPRRFLVQLDAAREGTRIGMKRQGQCPHALRRESGHALLHEVEREAIATSHGGNLEREMNRDTLARVHEGTRQAMGGPYLGAAEHDEVHALALWMVT